MTKLYSQYILVYIYLRPPPVLTLFTVGVLLICTPLVGPLAQSVCVYHTWFVGRALKKINQLMDKYAGDS